MNEPRLCGGSVVFMVVDAEAAPEMELEDEIDLNLAGSLSMYLLGLHLSEIFVSMT